MDKHTFNRIFIFSFSVPSSLWRKFIRQVRRYDYYQPTNLALWRKVYIRTNCWTLHVYLRHYPTNFLVDSQFVFLEWETTAMMLNAGVERLLFYWTFTDSWLLEELRKFKNIYIDIDIILHVSYKFSWTYQSQFPCLWQWIDERRTEVEQFTSIQSIYSKFYTYKFSERIRMTYTKKINVRGQKAAWLELENNWPLVRAISSISTFSSPNIFRCEGCDWVWAIMFTLCITIKSANTNTIGG